MRCGSTEVYHRPQYHPVRLVDGAKRLRMGVGVLGNDPHVLQASAGRGHRHLSADSAAGHPRNDIRLDDQGRGGHGHDPPVNRQQASHPVEPGDVVPEQLPQGQDEKVTQSVVVELALPLKTVLEHIAPGQAPLGVITQGCQRHPEVPRWQAVELPAQTPRGASVVGDGHDGGEPVADVFQSPERG